MQTTEIQTVIFEDKKKKRRSTGIALIYTFQKSQKNGGRSHFFFFRSYTEATQKENKCNEHQRKCACTMVEQYTCG